MDNAKNLTPKEAEIEKNILEKLKTQYGRTLEDATPNQVYNAVALSVRDTLMEKWTDYRRAQRRAGAKELYYLSFEFLMGRSLSNNLLNMSLTQSYAKVLDHMGFSLSDTLEQEPDAGLGNGGLGRLAACFMDSLATLGLPAFGSSIRYEYGLFEQKIVDGYQVEAPDPWLLNGTAWEVERTEERQYVRFGGTVQSQFLPSGEMQVQYDGATTVVGVPYDVPIAGYHSDVVNTLRLWKAEPLHELDFGQFSRGDYAKATEEKSMAEVLSKVLYPEDNHEEGKALRLKQQYFFVSCTMAWVVARYKKYNTDLSRLPEKVVIHINDTHPALAIPELMRILMDEERMGWDEAWDICTKVFAYTNHTILSEALEKWPQEMFKRLIPRIWQIVDEMNNRQVARLRGAFGDDWGKINYMSIVAHNYVSMANLCLSACFAVNGVSGLHTDILKRELFADYYRLNPSQFHAITNGITYRRWITLSNPRLANLITEKIGDGWILNSEKLAEIEPYQENAAFRKAFWDIKQDNKRFLADYILKTTAIKVDPNSIFDVQVKRLHEYKRQMLNVLHILYLYDKLKKNPNADIYPRTFIFGAKASPGYARAKLIIKLICSVADLINSDESIGGKLKVVFVENYGVTLAEKIIRAADVSEQISTAGKEASGTGNMKFMLNGALTVGTLDGANVEMHDLLGDGNIFIFGMTAAEVAKVRQLGAPSSQSIYAQNPEIKRVVDMLIDGTVSPSNPNQFYDLYNALLGGDAKTADEYMLIRDFESYVRVQEQVNRAYQNRDEWVKKAITNVARAGFFSSDRTILEYNQKIWHLAPFTFEK